MTKPEQRILYPAGFTLVELLVVIGLMLVLSGFLIPALNSLKSAGGVTAAAYDISGALETARAHAMAHNTYVWVGFFEEDAAHSSSTPAVEGVGRVVLAMVASKDGAKAYDPNSGTNPDLIDGTRLSRINRLVKIDNVTLASFPDGSGTGNTFHSRPPAKTDFARIGGQNPPTKTRFPFQIPLGAPAGEAKYTFEKTIQFSPRGEAVVNSTYSLRPTVEIGLRPTHGNVIDMNSSNVVAIQITGVTGNVAVFRP